MNGTTGDKGPASAALRRIFGIGFCRRGAACCALILILALSAAHAAEPIALTGIFDPNDNPSRPIFARFYPTDASCTAGAKGTSFKLLTPAYGLTRIGVRPLPHAKRLQTYNRPRTLLLITETRTYRLHVAEDLLSKSTQTVWFDLPKADRSGCFSLSIETSYAPSDGRRLARAEMAVRTEAEDGRGLLGIAGDLNNPERRRQAALLLEHGGAASLAAVAAVWPDLNRQGRFLAVGVIAHTDPAGGAPLLADVLITGTEAEREAARRGLMAAGPAAITALAAQAGKGDRARRSLLRRHISSFLARDPNRTAVLGELIAKADAQDDAEALFDLIRAGASQSELGGQILEITVRRYQNNANFADRYRLLQLMGRLACADSKAHLVAAAADPDKLIRAIAVASLGSCKNPDDPGVPILQQRLTDPAPEVRLAALRSIGNRAMEKPVLHILNRLAASDPWPEVRAQVIIGTQRLSPAEAIPILEKTIRDPSPRVREAALKHAIPIASEEIDRMIEERLADKEELPRIKRIAADAAGRRCQETAIPALFPMLQKGAEPLADPEDVSSAVSAARAMGAIGGENAEKLLKKAKLRSNPATDKAIDAALRALEQPCSVRKSS